MPDFNKRFGRDDRTGTNAPQQPGGSVAVGERGAPAARDETITERGRDHVRGDHDHDGVRERGTATSAHDVRARQRDAFGGFNWGSAFFGWLVAIGIGALLTAILSAAGTAIGL